MIREPLTMFCYVDISGQVRGKGFPARLLDKRLASGVGWTPTNIMFTPLGTIAPSPFGPFGDLILKADRKAEANVDFGDGSPKEHFFLCDVLETDGSPWDCCPRTLLRNAAEELRREAGVTLRIAFEHEFFYAGARGRVGDLYALDGVRRHGTFGETFLAALDQCGIESDSYLSEFGEGQFEVTFPPEEPLAACDKAVILREMARGTAWRLGHTVSFSPRMSPTSIGNGLHIHLSLWDEAGRPISHDPKGPRGVSATAGKFLAGAIKHMPALCAFTAPTPVSYLRLVPHMWSAAWSSLGYRDREAGIRICPTFATSERSTEEQFNFEYRAADASACPYIQVAAIVKAGLAGLRGNLPTPEPLVEQDPGNFTDAERQGRGIVRLPASLDTALDALDADQTVQAFLPPIFLKAYCANKRAEAALSKDWSAEDLCRRYSEVF
ncbi:MAG TPA: glutamine synthetase family protein [Dongiaceae bacterium]|jgi:glutamine synthetase|nr:glutamine synthetase family protein [Dongiaceae bacterium]